MPNANADYVCPFHVGQRVQVRPEFKREGDFEEAVVREIDRDDWTIDVDVDGKDWGQWFTRLSDGSYEIEPTPAQIDNPEDDNVQP